MPSASIIEKGFSYRLPENDPRPFGKAGAANPNEAVADLILDETKWHVLAQFAARAAPSHPNSPAEKDEVDYALVQSQY